MIKTFSYELEMIFSQLINRKLLMHNMNFIYCDIDRYENRLFFLINLYGKRYIVVLLIDFIADFI